MNPDFTSVEVPKTAGVDSFRTKEKQERKRVVFSSMMSKRKNRANSERPYTSMMSPVKKQEFSDILLKKRLDTREIMSRFNIGKERVLETASTSKRRKVVSVQQSSPQYQGLKLKKF